MQYQCPKCGNLIEEGTSPCPTCGQTFNWPTPVAPIAPTAPVAPTEPVSSHNVFQSQGTSPVNDETTSNKKVRKTHKKLIITISIILIIIFAIAFYILTLGKEFNPIPKGVTANLGTISNINEAITYVSYSTYEEIDGTYYLYFNIMRTSSSLEDDSYYVSDLSYGNLDKEFLVMYKTNGTKILGTLCPEKSSQIYYYDGNISGYKIEADTVNAVICVKTSEITSIDDIDVVEFRGTGEKVYLSVKDTNFIIRYLVDNNIV